MDVITKSLADHYARTFDEHGAVARGVDWGPEADVRLRYDKMLAVIERDPRSPHPGPPPRAGEGGRPSLLDAGCGYGGLLMYARERGMDLDYTGVDVCGNMIEHASAHVSGGRFLVRDVFDLDGEESFDYVVCNGILTQKLIATRAAMDDYAERLIRRLFALARRGVAFNVMTTHVNFMVENLYYRDPAEVLAWCVGEVTPRVAIDHAYPLYEFTTYLYRDDEP
jgi:SAM-dependent methyltransferase